MPDQNWKKWERQVCNDFGGTRAWEIAEECEGTGMWAPEAKYRKKIPNWLEDMMCQAEAQAHDNQLPLVCLTEKQRRRRDALVIIRYGDFLDWYVHGPLDASPAEEVQLRLFE